MLNSDHAIIISEAIDDHRQPPTETDGAVRDELARQLRVDSLLRGAAPGLARPSPNGLADRILEQIARTNPDHMLLKRVGLAPAFAAAAALVLASVTWLTLSTRAPQSDVLHGAPLGSLRLPTDVASPISLSLESPYRSEAKRLQEDTQRAADAVLAYLPLAR